MNNVECEMIFSKDGILVRLKTNLPLVGESWVEKKTPYERASELFTDKGLMLHVKSIESKIEGGILKLKLGDVKEISTTLESRQLEKDDGAKIVDSIRMITNRNIKSVPDGTKIRFDWRGVTYETKIDSSKGKKFSLNSLVQDVCRTSKGDKVSVNIYSHIKARYLDETGWHPLDDLRI